MVRSQCFSIEEIARKVSGTHSIFFNERILTSPDQVIAECMLIMSHRLQGLPIFARAIAAQQSKPGGAEPAPRATRQCPKCRGERGRL